MTEPPESSQPQGILRFSPTHVRWLVVALVVSIVVLALVFRARLTNIEESVDTLGYFAIFVTSLIGAAGMVVPLPGTAAIFIGGALLTPALVGLVAGLAEALGEITGYALGYSGAPVIQRARIYKRFEGWVEKRGWIVILLFAMIPNPVFDFFGVAAGVLRYPLKRFLVLAFVGKTVKNTGIAYAGYLGSDWVRELLGISP
jgi:membrane protein DedA with SNARE-associated domain